MIISQIIWWIWNQMFQYAFGKYTAQRLWIELFLDINWLGRPTFGWYQKRNFALNNLNIPNLKYIYTPFHNSESIRRNIFDYWWFFFGDKITYPHIYDIIKQNWFEYKDIYVPKTHKSEYNTNINPKKYYLKGFWQSEKFWKPICDEIKSEFALWYQMPQIASSLISKIQNTNSIAINIRRTDFVQISKIANIHDVCSTQYYQNSIDYIYSDLWGDCEFFVFSDDILRVKKNLKFPNKATFVDPKIYKWFEYELYMYILWQCKHYIIPNSSFAWRSVYLWRNRDKKVIIPDKRFNNNFDTNDLIPEHRNTIIMKT